MPVTYDEKTTCDELVKVYASHIKGKTVITTGVSAGGMGSAFVTSIARAQPSLLILAGRTRDKLQETARAILQDNPNVAVRPVVVDLASMASVRQAAADINAWDDVPKIDVLVNSAGIMKVPYQLTPDGFELTLATNYLGHFLFTNLIMDKLMAAASPRVILLGSDAHRLSPLRWGDPQFDNGTLYNGWAAYGQSKTALMLMAISLAEKLGNKGLRVFAIHPGVVMGTNLTSHLDAAIDLPDLRKSGQSLDQQY
jgi:NAD(P)-dependent dehydrogenase (short-subunit alcohol dehydrogenase family)